LLNVTENSFFPGKKFPRDSNFPTSEKLFTSLFAVFSLRRQKSYFECFSKYSTRDRCYDLKKNHQKIGEKLSFSTQNKAT
jgi:hypothetical protein